MLPWYIDLGYWYCSVHKCSKVLVRQDEEWQLVCIYCQKENRDAVQNVE